MVEHGAIVSVPHSGTHTLLHHLGWQSIWGQAIDSTPDVPVIMDHVWGWKGAKGGVLMADNWADLLTGRRAFMPVRDPAELAWAWPNVHNRALALLKSTLTEACKLLRLVPTIELVDIRELSAKNVKGTGERDNDTGAELLEAFPLYFGAYYGG